MEPITIHFNRERLLAVCRTMENVGYIDTNDKSIKADRSIFSQTRAKLLSKLITKEKARKDFKIKLAYHEAYQLEKWLREWLLGQNASIEATLVSLVADELDQKLT